MLVPNSDNLNAATRVDHFVHPLSSEYLALCDHDHWLVLLVNLRSVRSVLNKNHVYHQGLARVSMGDDGQQRREHQGWSAEEPELISGWLVDGEIYQVQVSTW